MIYRIKAHPTKYNNTAFRSRLEATWAAFFDLAKWEWKYEPTDLVGWVPDFWVRFPCGHRECHGSHELYIDVKPYLRISDFDRHVVSKIDRYEIPSPAKFGIGPSVTEWEMVHGHGSAIESVYGGWVRADVDSLWGAANEITQWKPNTGGDQ